MSSLIDWYMNKSYFWGIYIVSINIITDWNCIIHIIMLEKYPIYLTNNELIQMIDSDWSIDISSSGQRITQNGWHVNEIKVKLECKLHKTGHIFSKYGGAASLPNPHPPTRSVGPSQTTERPSTFVNRQWFCLHIIKRWISSALTLTVHTQTSESEVCWFDIHRERGKTQR